MNPETFLDGRVVLHKGDCLDVLKTLADNSIDSVVTDPPYALVSITRRFGKSGAAPVKVPEGGTGAYARASAGFMGKAWDTGERAFSVEFWAEVWRVLKPGGHVAAFSGTRTYHRLAVAIEDAGFEIRDQLAWAYGSGFPKSHDVSKAIDKAAGAEREKHATGKAVKRMIPGADQNKDGWEKTNGREYVPGIEIPATAEAEQWQGWGTALKPAWEPICLARKPLIGTVAENVLTHGTGAINVDGCRVGTDGGTSKSSSKLKSETDSVGGYLNAKAGDPIDAGRWPANILHDGSEEVLAGFPETSSGSKAAHHTRTTTKTKSVYGERAAPPEITNGDFGSAARFFYTAKADAHDRIGSKHPTVKPVDLMQWLCRLITPPGGTLLDPFAGTGSTGEAAWREGFNAILVERETEYQTDIAERMRLALSGPDEKRREIIKRKGVVADAGPLFGVPSKSHTRGEEGASPTGIQARGAEGTSPTGTGNERSEAQDLEAKEEADQ